MRRTGNPPSPSRCSPGPLTLTNSLHPQLHAAWQTATLKNAALGDQLFDLTYRKNQGKFTSEATLPTPQLPWLTATTGCTLAKGSTHRLELDLPPFEIEVPQTLAEPGAPVACPKILFQSNTGFEVEGLRGSTAQVEVRFTNPRRQIQAASLTKQTLAVRFPSGEGYQRTSVQFTW